MRLFTIGFTRKTAEQFFTLLGGSGARRIVDVRLNNTSQLAAFAKQDDLAFFARRLCDMDYVHEPRLAPTQQMIDRYRKEKRGWPALEREFRALLRKRKVEDVIPREVLDDACLLCSEEMPDHCHRRLVAEHFADAWGDVTITHLT